MNAGADLDKVEYAAVNGMLATLDPHSILMDPEQARDMDVSTSGKFGGLGIVIKMVDRKLTVVRPIKDTPAWRAGVKANDHIVRINNEATENLTSNEAVERMRGEPHTGLTLWVSRKDNDQLLRFDLVRDVIRVSQVEHKLLDHGVGYIKVKQFSKNIASDVADAMKEMSGQGANAWILDLRGNPGGLLDEAVQLVDLFVDTGTIVTTVSSRDRDSRRAERGNGDTTSSLVVLVNGGSASASEIVAGALKNLDRAVIIGTRTFGKGSVQELYDNDDHSKLKLTIAQYLTPGDRSIQNVGIVPDVQLQREYIPDKNDAPGDIVRLLAPTHSYGEKDLDAHLVSTYAKDTDKPEYELPFVYEKAAQAGQEAAPPDEDDPPDDDEYKEDFEIRFARDLASGVTSNNRQKLAAGARQLVAKVRADEEKKLVAQLEQIGVDWSSAPAPSQADLPANLDVSIAAPANIHAGDTVDITATVHNAGTGTAYRVLPRLQADDGAFEDIELPIGKVAPGDTRTYTAKVQIPKDAHDRIDRLGVDVREARNASVHSNTTDVRIEATPLPVFAYAYQLVDDGNGDGLLQRGEHYRLDVQVKNTGAGPTGSDGVTVLLRNATGDGVVLDKSRFEIKDAGALPPGQTRDFEFPLATDATLKGDEMVVELVIYDNALDAQVSEKLHFKLVPTVASTTTRGDVTVKSAVEVHAGASDDTGVIGVVTRGASFPALGVYGSWTKVKLDANRVGFVPTAVVGSGGGGTGSWLPQWNSTPPMIALDPIDKGLRLETSADTYKLHGLASDDSHVEDVYIFVSNQPAKIENRKVFYQSNRGGKDGKAMDFTTDLPLWPGSNMVTVVARSSSEVQSRRTLFVYRDPARTAQTP